MLTVTIRNYAKADLQSCVLKRETTEQHQGGQEKDGGYPPSFSFNNNNFFPVAILEADFTEISGEIIKH